MSKAKGPEALYAPLDAFEAEMKAEIKREFAPLSLAGFDELTVIRTKERVERLYDRINRKARKRYAYIIMMAYEWAYSQTGKVPPSEKWDKLVDEFLRGYDRVTGYVYENELERKAMRLVEAILAAKEYVDRAALTEAVKKAANLLYTQVTQEALDMIEESVMQAYQKMEVQTVRYHAYMDARVCEECAACNLKVYELKEAPPLPQHYHCRCYYTPGPKKIVIRTA